MTLPTWAVYNPNTKILDITCQLCQNHILWNPVDPATVILSIAASVADGGSSIKYHSIICPFIKNNAPCQTVYEIKYNHSVNDVDNVTLTPQGWYERMLIDMAKKWQENTIPTLDKRAEYMITTIVGLIAVNFGIIYVFNISDIFNISDLVIKLVPNVFLSISVLFFALSHFPEKRTIRLDVPKEILEAYETNIDRKYYMQKLGYALFIVGLITIAIAASASFYTVPDSISNVSLKGEVTLLPPP